MSHHERLDAWFEQVDELLANYAELDVTAVLGVVEPVGPGEEVPQPGQDTDHRPVSL